MVWRMDDDGVVDLFFHSPKENIKHEPSLYLYHNPKAILVNPIVVQANPVAL